MDIRIIKTKQQYRRYLEEVDRLVALDPDPRTAEGARLELLAKLVEDYEKEHFKFRKPDPVEAILFRLEARHSERVADSGTPRRVSRRAQASQDEKNGVTMRPGSPTSISSTADVLA